MEMDKMSKHFMQELEEKMGGLNKEAQTDDGWKWKDFRKALLSGNSRGPYLEDRLEYLSDVMNGVDQKVSDTLLALSGQAHKERTGKEIE